MSNKLKKENIEQLGVEKNFFERIGIDPISFWVMFSLTFIFLTMVIFIFYFYIDSKEDAPPTAYSKFELILPDFSTLTAAPSAENAPTEKVEGTIGSDMFYDIAKERAEENLLKMKPILGDDIYQKYIQGLETQYYSDSVNYDYKDFINDMDGMLQESGLIEALYNTYAEDYEMPTYTNCHGEECTLLDYIETYTKGELHDYLKERHDMWESIMELEAERTKVDESYVNLFYQDEICANYDYVTDVQVEVMLLTQEQYDLGYDLLQEAYNAGNISTKFIDIKDNRDCIDSFRLYKDIDYYDEGFKDLTVDTFNTYFASEVIDNSVYLGGIDPDGDKEQQLADLLKDIQVPTQDVEEKNWSDLENWCVETFSLAGRNEEDLIYVLWKVVPGSCKHDLAKIPDKESLYTRLSVDSRYYIASKLISDTIYAENNDLTEEEIHEMLKSNYGYTDEELHDLTEEQKADLLLEEQDKADLLSQLDIEEIKVHMEADGHDLTDMTDDEIIELYIKSHGESTE